MSANMMDKFPTAQSDSTLSNLSQWLDRAITEGATRFSLRQKSDGAEQNVREFTVPDREQASAFADAILGRAEEDARHFRGRAIYGLFAFRGREPLDRMFFAVDGNDGALGSDSRDATLGHVTSQLMRHNEVNARLAVGQTIDIISHYKSMVAARDKRIDDLEAKYWKVTELYENLLSMQHERDLEARKARRDEKNQDYLREKFDAMTPVVLSKLMPGAAKTGPLGEELIRQFLKGLSGPQMDAVLGMLKPEQAAIMNEIYLAYCEREVAKDEAKQRAKIAEEEAFS